MCIVLTEQYNKRSAKGVVAGDNVLRRVLGIDPLVLPRTTMLGDFLAYANERWNKKEGLTTRFHFGTGPFFQRAREI